MSKDSKIGYSDPVKAVSKSGAAAIGTKKRWVLRKLRRGAMVSDQDKGNGHHAFRDILLA
jgi:hypothetical protein